jgi:hypothetical protein
MNNDIFYQSADANQVLIFTSPIRYSNQIFYYGNEVEHELNDMPEEKPVDRLMS